MTPRVAIVASGWSSATDSLVAAGGSDWCVLTPAEAVAQLQPGDTAIGRIDVRPTLDGIETGLWALGSLAARGVAVLNGAACLLACHDKHVTARVLGQAGLPHPRTTLIRDEHGLDGWAAPVVIKPRFGSWGGGVTWCDTDEELAMHLEYLSGEHWFVRDGALVQELVPPAGHDLRVVVAGRKAVGAVVRVCADGEWRTNVALGARRLPANAPGCAVELALRAAAAVGGDLVGVDLLPDGQGGWTILEVNGAVEFGAEYALEHDVFSEAVSSLIGSASRSALSSQ